MTIRNLFIVAIITSLIASCKKDKAATPQETLQISFKLDGQEYSQVVSNRQINGLWSDSYDLGQGNFLETKRADFNVNDSMAFDIQFGFISRKANDSVFSYQSLKQALATGTREYKCLECDSSIRNGVAVGIENLKTLESWGSYKVTNDGPVPNKNEQTGSSFTITDIKETTIKNYPAGFIVKGTFNCTIFKWGAPLEKHVLTDGNFTFFMYPY